MSAGEAPDRGAENAATLLARAVVDALVDGGVRHVVLAPGSRNAPLAYALLAAEQAGRLALHVRVDERSAGFVALGIARGTGDVAAVVTTSGTAVANLHPAVLEAGHARVGLLVVSADRPPELRGTGANQTTDQVGLFGVGDDVSRPRWSVDLVQPGGSGPAAAGLVEDLARAATGRALAAARGEPGAASGARLDGVPGPVHVNVGLREPLVPDGPWDAGRGAGSGPAPAAAPSSRSAATPTPAVAPASSVVGVMSVRRERSRRTDITPTTLGGRGVRTVVVAGDGAGPLARELAESAGLPLLAEPSSGARGGPCALEAPAQLLGVPGLGDAIQRVVVLGRPTLTRAVTRLLARQDVDVVVTDPPGRAWIDPPGARHVDAAALMLAPGDPAWLASWRAASDAVGRVLDAGASQGGDVAFEDGAAGRAGGEVAFEDGAAVPGGGEVAFEDGAAGLSGPVVARLTARAAASAGDLLLAGSSMAVRHLDTAAAPSDGVVLANRGLAGIDGTVSTAVGLALAGAGRPGGTVRVLLGDLTFLHDAGGLARGALEAEVDVQLVVLHDDGGAIFATLEQGEARLAPAFERVFGTPQGVDLAALAAAYGAQHVRVRDVAELTRALAAPAPGRTVVEVRLSRADARASGRALAERLAAVAAAALT